MVVSPRKKAMLLCLSVSIIVLLPLWWLICNFYEDQLINEQKFQDNIELHLIKNALSHAMARRTALFEGLCAFVESDPSEDHLKAEANILMSGLYSHAKGIRVMALAPSGIRRYVYPLKGHESVVGHNILHDKRPHVQNALQLAIKSKKIVFSGPYELRQGGLALVMRKAIFLNNKLWGLAALVIDIPPIIEESGLLLKSNDMELALKDQQGQVFFGKDTVFNSTPLTLKVDLLYGYWELAGLPIGGWKSFVNNKLRNFQLFSFLIVVLTAAVIYLFSYRHGDLLQSVKAKTRELSNSIENLKYSEERLFKFMDSATDGFILFDSELILIEMNNRALEIIGLKRENVIGKSILDVVPDIRESGRFDAYKAVMETGTPIHFSDLTSHPLIGDKHIELNAFSVGNGLGIIFSDITDRKRAEENLEKSHEAIKRQNKIFSVINRLFQEAIECKSTSDVAQVCLSIAEEITGSQYGSVAEVNENNRFNTLSLSNPGWEECKMAELNPTMIHDMEVRGIWGAALQSQHGLIINDPSNHPLSVGTPENHPPLHCFLGMPFQHKNFNGMIGIANKESGYTETDREIIEALALAFAEVINSKRIEEVMRESERKYSVLFETNPAGVVITGAGNGRILEINDSIEKMTGYSRQESIGRSSLEIGFWQNPNDREKVVELLKEKESFRNLEFKFTHKSGEVKDGLFSSELVIIQNEPCIITAMFDVTKGKRDRELLKDSEERLRTIIDANLDAMIVIDNKGRITLFNPAAEKTFKYRKEEVIGQSPAVLMPESYRSQHEIDVKSFFATGKPNNVINQTIEVPALRADGEEFPIEISLSIGGSGEHAFVVGMIRDITDRKRAEKEKKALEEQLLQSQKLESIGNLAGGIAHDFNNILSSVIGFTELSLDEVDEGSMLEDNLQEVYTAGKRAKELVGQILAFARQSEEKVKPIQVDKIVEEVLQFIRSSIPATIEIKKNINSDSLIMGNQTQVYQIMMNLCTNAAYAMEKEGGLLKVDLKDIIIDRDVTNVFDLKYGNYIEISVSDSGAGIPSSIIDSIFEPYFTTKDPGEGTGMGLAMVLGIVESYGGKITVESNMGEGTTFTIFLPITRKRKTQRQYEPEQLPSGTEKILLVDDEAPIAKMGSQGLKRLGYKVTTRTSSIKALELFKSKPFDFDLVITDMTMPNMTGDRLSLELMAIRPEIPVIICTGYSKKISDETVSEIGIKALVYKPIVKAELAKTVRKVLDEANTPKQSR